MQTTSTDYGGFRFRSRLEARWAVFFDALDIDYRYEPEGFEIPWRLVRPHGSRPSFRYLPDFYLPDLNLWAEVKGRWRALEGSKIIDAAATLSDRSDGLLILGDLTRWPSMKDGRGRRPVRLFAEDGEILSAPWPPVDSAPPSVYWSRDLDRVSDRGDPLDGYDAPLPDDLCAALTAARRRDLFQGAPTW